MSLYNLFFLFDVLFGALGLRLAIFLGVLGFQVWINFFSWLVRFSFRFLVGFSFWLVNYILFIFSF
jgi:hypothetical protein